MFKNRKLLIPISFFAAIILGAVVLAADSKIRAERSRAASARYSLDGKEFVDNSIKSASTAQTRTPIQVVRFALYDAGILPHEARVTAGRVVIWITDFTGGTGGLVVQRDLDRTDVGQVRREGARWRGRQELNLSAGTYHLFDASRRENRATLIVAPPAERP